jgi:hypothetical protein
MRRVLRSNDEVAHFWANKTQPEGRAHSMFFEDDVIYSYGTHFPIAKHYPEGVAFTKADYSVTTQRHKSITRRAIPSNVKVIYVCNPIATAHFQLHETRQEVLLLLDRAKRARKYATTYKSQAQFVADSFNVYAEWRGESCRIETGLDADALRAEIEREDAERVERIRLEEERREARFAEQVEQWVRGERILPPYTRTPRLRINGDVVETSWGADIPVEEAKRLWPCIVRVMRGDHDRPVGVRVGHYTLTKIRRDGSILVGCHDIAFSEIERIAKQLGLLPECFAREVA